MKIKTLIQSILVALLFLLSPIYNPVMGLSNNDYKFDSENFAKQNSLSDIDIIEQNKFITIQGVKNYFTPEFKNPDNALVDLASKIKIYLGIIQQKYSLEVFSKDTVDIYYNLMMNGYVVGLTFYFLFMNSFLILVSRGSLYFTIMEPFLLAAQMLAIEGRRKQICVLLLMLIYSVLMFYKSIESYPELFIPYKWIL